MYIVLTDFENYLPSFKRGTNYGLDWGAPWIKMPRRLTDSDVWEQATAAQRGWFMAVVRLYIDKCVTVTEAGYVATKPLALHEQHPSKTGLSQKKHVSKTARLFVRAGFLAIPESGSNRTRCLDRNGMDSNRMDSNGLDSSGMDSIGDDSNGTESSRQNGKSEDSRGVPSLPQCPKCGGPLVEGLFPGEYQCPGSCSESGVTA